MITFVTPTIVRPQLAELAASIEAQTVPAQWSVLTDHHGEGPAPLRNRMVESALTEWVNPIDDDDLLDPDYTETILANLDDADIVYAWSRVEGRWDTDCYQKTLEHSLSQLRYENNIPNCAAIRRDLWLEVGGQRDVAMEDWDFWLRAQHAGARFKCVERPLWTIRMGDWVHRTDEVA